MIWLNRRADTVYCIVRLTIGLMFACHGRQNSRFPTKRTTAHAPSVLERLLLILNKGELPVLFCFMFLLIMFYGPGRWSIDSLLKGTLERATSSSS